MELNFNKEKQRVAEMSDAELIARIRDPRINATDRMLVEAEIARRGVNRHQRVSVPREPEKRGSKLMSNLFSLLIVGGIVISIVASMLDDMGIDIIEWLRELLSGAEG
ncbi:MAG: hypothetical protein HKO55_02915 [Gammaproteobacteria bacterium]|nr:hypothetical protein [Gammaproteobacteria bacterium]NNM20207.1 hypothetical protein [Gammaproteobacteria bacterium]